MTTTHEAWTPSTIQEWHARSVHKAELWSGAKVLFRFRSLGELIAQGELPDDLANLALLELAEKDLDGGGIVGAMTSELMAAKGAGEEAEGAALERAKEMGQGAAEIMRRLVAFSLVEPALTAEDLAHPDFPMQDLEMLAGIINRQVLFDAAGRRMGVEPLDTFATFRGFHKCPEDCPQCEAARVELSSVHMGQV